MQSTAKSNATPLYLKLSSRATSRTQGLSSPKPAVDSPLLWGLSDAVANGVCKVQLPHRAYRQRPLPREHGSRAPPVNPPAPVTRQLMDGPGRNRNANPEIRPACDVQIASRMSCYDLRKIQTRSSRRHARPRRTR